MMRETLIVMEFFECLILTKIERERESRESYLAPQGVSSD
jgi:hypothetical protein